MILYRQREFTSKRTKAVRRNILYKAADNSWEKDNAKELLEEGKISQKGYDQLVIRKGKERLGINKPIVSDGGYTINLENLPTSDAGNVNTNARIPGQFATKGKSKAEKQLTKARTKLEIQDYRVGGRLGAGYNVKLRNLIENSNASDAEKRQMKMLVNKGEQKTYDELAKLENDAIRSTKLVRVEKMAKKAGPWVIGGSAAVGATVAGVHAYKKHKNKKEK